MTPRIKSKYVEEGECWIWTGYVAQGVPYVYHDGRMQSVRRVLAGPDCTRGYLFAACGDQRCINPAHTKWRSNAAHMPTIARKQRSPASEQIRRAKIAAAKAHMRKLSDEQIAEIIHSGESCYVLADRYGVSRTLVSRYRRRGGAIEANPWAQLMRGIA